MRPVAASVVAWSMGAATAVGVGLVALSSIGTGFADQPLQPLAGTSVSQPAAPTTAAPTHPAPSTTTGPPQPTVATAGNPVSADRTINSVGGTVIARCLSAGAYLVGWSPAPGYNTDDLRRGPAAFASVTFESLQHEVQVSVRCIGGIPQSTVRAENSTGLDH